MSRIGIMGGTFNPIHIAHVNMAKQAYKQASLDKVLFMPSKNPPHKKSGDILPADIRADMVRLAIQDITKKRRDNLFCADCRITAQAMS